MHYIPQSLTKAAAGLSFTRYTRLREAQQTLRPAAGAPAIWIVSVFWRGFSAADTGVRFHKSRKLGCKRISLTAAGVLSVTVPAEEEAAPKHDYR